MADEEAEQTNNADKKDAYIMDEEFFRRLNPAFLEQKQKYLAKGILIQEEYDGWFGRPQMTADDLTAFLKRKLTIEECDVWFCGDNEEMMPRDRSHWNKQARYWNAVKEELIEGDEFWEIAGRYEGGSSFSHPFHFVVVMRGDKVVAKLPK